MIPQQVDSWKRTGKRSRCAMLSAYEKQRLENMAQNAAHLASLGIESLAIPKKPRSPVKRKAPGQPVRASARARQLPVPVYTPGSHEVLEESNYQEEVDKGARCLDGSAPALYYKVWGL